MARRSNRARLRIRSPQQPHLRLVVSNRRPLAKVLPPLAVPLARLQLALRRPRPVRLAATRGPGRQAALRKGPRLAALGMAAAGLAALAAAVGQMLVGVM